MAGAAVNLPPRRINSGASGRRGRRTLPALFIDKGLLEWALESRWMDEEELEDAALLPTLRQVADLRHGEGCDRLYCELHA